MTTQKYSAQALHDACAQVYVGTFGLDGLTAKQGRTLRANYDATDKAVQADWMAR